MRPLESEPLETAGPLDAIEVCYHYGWTDGLPVIPPSERRVREFLEYVALEPDHPLGEVPERAVVLTAEHAAMSAVMAGCKPQYFPVVVAAAQAVTDPAFHFNHLASMASPWPLLIVNGPVVRALDINSGMYLLGPGNRANATIGRALSLLLWIYAGARPGGVLRGQMGNVGRYSFCIAENEGAGWTPLHVLEGFEREQSTVTAISALGTGMPVRVVYRTARGILDHLTAVLSYATADYGTYAVVVSPAQAAALAGQGWTKEQARDYIKRTCRRSVADMKRCGHWDWDHFIDVPPPVEPGDDSRYVYLFRDGDEYASLAFPETMRKRRADVLLVVGGGDVGQYSLIVPPYPLSTNPVTRAIDTRPLGGTL